MSLNLSESDHSSIILSIFSLAVGEVKIPDIKAPGDISLFFRGRSGDLISKKGLNLTLVNDWCSIISI